MTAPGFVQGVVVPPSVCLFLERTFDFTRLRGSTHGDDAELDVTLEALHWTAMKWINRVDATTHATAVRPALDWFTPAEAAARLGVKPDSVRRGIREHRLPAEKHNGPWRINVTRPQHLPREIRMTDDLAEFDKSLDAIRAQASQVQAKYRAEVAEIANETRLSDEGRREETDSVRQRSQAQLDQLKAAEDKAIKDKVTSLERALFGSISMTNETQVLIRRDAEDRAERVKSADEAKKLLARAQRLNDPHLGQAIARVAAERGYRSVIDAYEAEHPGTGKKLSFLAALEEATSERGAVDYKMNRALAYRISAF